MTDIFKGLILATVWFLMALLVARFGFGRNWYLGILLPIGALIYLFLAWLLYLRDDGLIRARSGKAETVREGRPPAEGPEELSLFAPPPGTIFPTEELIPRRDEGPKPGPGARKSLRSSLLWAAIELVLIAAGLYSFAGIGARFY